MEELFYVSLFLVLLAVVFGTAGITLIAKMAGKRSRYSAMTHAQVMGIAATGGYELLYMVYNQTFNKTVHGTAKIRGPVTGDWIELRFNPANPEDIYIPWFESSQPLVLSILALVLAGVSFIGGALVMVVFIFSL